MGIIRFYTALILLICLPKAHAQSFFPIVQKNDVWFHEVIIREGMTLFSIAQDLGVTSSQIKSDNAGLSDNIKVGNKVLVRASRSNFSYTVVKGDTPYGISKKFGLSLDSLIYANPTIVNGLQVNQKISIKRGIKRYNDASILIEDGSEHQIKDSLQTSYRNFSFSDSVITYMVKSGDKLSVIAKRYLVNSAVIKSLNNLNSNTLVPGKTIKIPLKKSIEVTTVNTIPEKSDLVIPRTYIKPLENYSPKKVDKLLRIGVFLPFNRDSLVFPLKGTQKFAFDFYLGTLVAIDSLMNFGIKGDIYYFDIKTKEENIDVLINSGKLERFDLFIGPFTSIESDKLSKYSQLKKIPMVTPLSLKTEVSEKNEMFFAVATELTTQVELLARHLASNSDEQSVVLCKSNKASDSLLEEIFYQTYYANSSKESRLIVANESTIKAYTKSNSTIIIVCLSQDSKQVINLTKACRLNNKVKLYGLREWTEIKELSSNINYPSDFYYLSTTCFDMELVSVKKFHKAFRARFESDLTKGALLGYDILNKFVPWYFNEVPLSRGLMTAFGYGKTVNLYHTNLGGLVCRFTNFKSVPND